jgi:hypothetical protein
LGDFCFPPTLSHPFVIGARAGFGLSPGGGGGFGASLLLLVEGHLLHFQARGALVVAPKDSEVLVEVAQVA